MGWSVLSRHVRARGAVVLALLLPGCTLLVDTERVQCESNRDCEDLSAVETVCENSVCVEPVIDNTPFACRDTSFPDTSTSTVPFSMGVVSLVGQTPYEGLTLFACPQFDTACDTPLSQSTSDAEGRFTLDVPIGFRGHLFAPPPTADPMLAPRHVHIFPPPSETFTTTPYSIFVTDLMTVAGLTMLFGAEYVPGNGSVFFTASDCTGVPLEGVTVTVSPFIPQTFSGYVGAGGQLDPGLIGTGPIGQGAVVNVPPGFVTVSAIHETEGKIFEQSVLVAADTITSISTIVPSPTP